MTENGAVSAAEQALRVAGQAAVGALRENKGPTADRITLSNGIMLKLKPVSGLLVRRATSMVPRPDVPMWDNPDRGRPEPNPIDPDYIEALQRYEETTQQAALNVMLLIGTELISVPDGMSKPDDQDWSEAFDFVGIEVPHSGPGRYRDWLTYVALASTYDMIAVESALARLAGLSEGDLASVMDSFRSDDLGGAADVSDASADRDGDRVPVVDAGAGVGDGGA